MSHEKEGLTRLRARAEQRLRTNRQDQMPVLPEQRPQLTHELQVHQIELEMQNEELRRSHRELEAAPLYATVRAGAADRQSPLPVYRRGMPGHLTLTSAQCIQT